MVSLYLPHFVTSFYLLIYVLGFFTFLIFSSTVTSAFVNRKSICIDLAWFNFLSSRTSRFAFSPAPVRFFGQNDTERVFSSSTSNFSYSFYSSSVSYSYFFFVYQSATNFTLSYEITQYLNKTSPSLLSSEVWLGGNNRNYLRNSSNQDKIQIEIWGVKSISVYYYYLNYQVALQIQVLISAKQCSSQTIEQNSEFYSDLMFKQTIYRVRELCETRPNICS